MHFAQPRVEPVEVARVGLARVHACHGRPAWLVLVEGQVALLDLLPLLLRGQRAGGSRNVWRPTFFGSAHPRALRRARPRSRWAAVAAEAAQLVVKDRAEERYHRGPHHHLRLPQHLVGNVLVDEEGADRITEVVAVVDQHVVVADGEFELQLPLDKVPELLAGPHGGLTHIDDLCRCPVGGLPDLGLEDAASVPILPVKHHNAGVPDALHLPAQKHRGQPQGLAIRQVVLVQPHGALFPLQHVVQEVVVGHEVLLLPLAIQE
mmetsp:Transcript_61326/g.164090  ORF Transcript_61326/g.164090 Transcript_61326/m.164090 type:complete len:263 (-) Transcript_61326:531-1319(-)